jgi:hypothetical protein
MRGKDYGLVSTHANQAHRLAAVAGHHASSTEPTEHEIHLPGPSLSPPILGLGVTILAFGILFGLPLIVVGFGILVIGLVTWLIDDARRFAEAPDEGHH